MNKPYGKLMQPLLGTPFTRLHLLLLVVGFSIIVIRQSVRNADAVAPPPAISHPELPLYLKPYQGYELCGFAKEGASLRQWMADGCGSDKEATALPPACSDLVRWHRVMQEPIKQVVRVVGQSRRWPELLQVEFLVSGKTAWVPAQGVIQSAAGGETHPYAQSSTPNRQGEDGRR